MVSTKHDDTNFRFLMCYVCVRLNLRTGDGSSIFHNRSCIKKLRLSDYRFDYPGKFVKWSENLATLRFTLLRWISLISVKSHSRIRELKVTKGKCKYNINISPNLMKGRLTGKV